MRTRLSTIAPELDLALQRAQPESSARAALVAATWALERVGLGDYLSKPDVDFGVLSDSFDEAYFAEDEGRPEKDQFFSLARAASAMDFARAGEPAESIYEAMATVDDPEELREIVTRALSSGV